MEKTRKVMKETSEEKNNKEKALKIIEKWKNLGMLEGLKNAEHQAKMAQVLESQAREVLHETEDPEGTERLGATRQVIAQQIFKNLLDLEDEQFLFEPPKPEEQSYSWDDDEISRIFPVTHTFDYELDLAVIPIDERPRQIIDALTSEIKEKLESYKNLRINYWPHIMIILPPVKEGKQAFYIRYLMSSRSSLSSKKDENSNEQNKDRLDKEEEKDKICVLTSDGSPSIEDFNAQNSVIVEDLSKEFLEKLQETEQQHPQTDLACRMLMDKCSFPPGIKEESKKMAIAEMLVEIFAFSGTSNPIKKLFIPLEKPKITSNKKLSKLLNKDSLLGLNKTIEKKLYKVWSRLANTRKGSANNILKADKDHEFIKDEGNDYNACNSETKHPLEEKMLFKLDNIVIENDKS